MTSESRTYEVVGGARFEVAPHRCFACGTLNTSGMGLVLHVERDRAWTELELDPRFQGWDGIGHGGIVCTILDEVMAWSLAGADDWGMTARMQVEFRRPAPLVTPLRAEGWITRSRRRLIETRGRLVERTTGQELATSTGVYMAADADRKAELRARYRVRASDTPEHVDEGR